MHSIRKLLFCFFLPFLSLCADDLETIRPILDQYNRPVTILSIGENKLIYQIAQNDQAICILATPKKLQGLNTHQIIHLKKRLSFEDLLDLNRREHFDFIIAFHSIHELNPWKNALHELFKLCDHLIVKISPADGEKAQTHPAIFSLAHYLTNLGLTNYLDSKEEDHFLWYSFKPKSVYPHLYTGKHPKGITLATYAKHQGVLPSKEWIKQEKKKLPLWKRVICSSIRINGKTLH